MGKTVAIAGHFNPLHTGHIELIKEARKLGDWLVVIVANDFQASLKRPKLFQSQLERAVIMANIRGVDDVFISIDETPEVVESIAQVKPDVFASGCGEDHEDALKEKDVCEKLGIETVFNVGGDKIKSSSEILKRYASN